MKKNIVILGSTGSIGENAIIVAKRLPENIKVIGLAANRNYKRLAEQCSEVGCKRAVCNQDHKDELSNILGDKYKVEAGLNGMINLCTAPEVDIVLCSIVGTDGLFPVLEAIKAGKDIALASKEVLVLAGSIVMKKIDEYGVNIIPVDSEHNAIFQCIEGKKHTDISKLILTASGGTFRDAALEDIQKATYKDALAHPTWNMGPKITIDSASLMNKALEIIEARWLFDVPGENIDVVIHPQSIIHSMVEFNDGSTLAQMSVPDMRFPIQYALTYPEKVPGDLEQLNLAKIGNLSFHEPDKNKFPSLEYAYEALKKGSTMPAVMNAANEIAVERFSKGEIPFAGIWRIIERIMTLHSYSPEPSLEAIVEADRWARVKAAEFTP